MHVLKTLFFIKIALKLRYFCKKMQNFRALGAPPPNPRYAGAEPECRLQNNQESEWNRSLTLK